MKRAPPFNVADYLTDPETTEAYINELKAEIERLQVMVDTCPRCSGLGDESTTEIERLRERVKMLELLTQTMIEAALNGSETIHDIPGKMGF